jgi:hypothetical protein
MMFVRVWKDRICSILALRELDVMPAPKPPPAAMLTERLAGRQQ